MNNINGQNGFIRLIILLIVAILVLSYFNIDLKSLANKPTTQSNIGYVLALGGQVWQEYLSKPLAYFWNNVFVDLLWKAFVNNFELLKQGKPPIDFSSSASDQNKINNIIKDIKTLQPKPIQ